MKLPLNFSSVCKSIGLALIVLIQPVISHAVETNWTGGYVGLVGGHSWGSTDNSWQPANTNSQTLVLPTYELPFSSNHLNLDSFSGGGEVGFNYQVKQFIVGVEGDFQYSGANASSTVADNSVSSRIQVATISCDPGVQSVGFKCPTAPTSYSPPSSTNTVQVKNEWYSTIRARAGWTHKNFMGYVTGGFAMSQYDLTITSATTPLSSSSLLPGYAVGGGFEYRAWSNISLKAEYLYLNFQNSGATSNGPLIANNAATLDQHSVRVGINYHF